MTKPPIQVTISSRTNLAEGVVGLELVGANGLPLPSFSAGSHIDVHLKGDVIRQYSLWNDPLETHRYCLGILKEEKGRGGSEAMHDLRVGSSLEISAPRNNFELERDAVTSVFLAGGIGITPILCMAQTLHDQGSDFVLHYCSRTESRMAFQDMLLTSGFADKVHFHFDDGPAEQKFELRSLAKAPMDGTHLYVCGPTGFMDAVLTSAKDAWPASALHREYFTAVAVETDGADRAFQIQIKSTCDKIEIPVDKSIVEVLTDIGIELPVSCEQGICGTCLTPVLQGTPDHRDLVLNDEEHAKNDQMTLCCSRALTDLLVLDL